MGWADFGLMTNGLMKALGTNQLVPIRSPDSGDQKLATDTAIRAP